MADQQKQIDILGIIIDNITMEEAVEKISALLASKTGGYVVTPNPEIIQLCQQEPDLADLINGATVVIPDGIGVVYAARLLKRPIRSRVPGVELGEMILPDAAKRGDRLYIYGGKPGIAEKAAVRLAEKYPGLTICGTSDGYCKDDGLVCQRIREAAPDLLYVCLGAPAQERWMASHADQFPACLMFGLGGSVDIYSGTVNRAPKFWRKLNLEWFYRLLCQPRRIGRLAKRLPAFFKAVFQQRRQEKRQK